MTVSIDTALLLQSLDDQGIDGILHAFPARWHHIGTTVVDAVLQRRQHYMAIACARVENVVAVWPDAATVSGFGKRIDEGDLSMAIRWKSEERLTHVKDIVAVLEGAVIETVGDLRSHLLDPLVGRELRVPLPG